MEGEYLHVFGLEILSQEQTPAQGLPFTSGECSLTRLSLQGMTYASLYLEIELLLYISFGEAGHDYGDNLTPYYLFLISPSLCSNPLKRSA